MKIASFHQSLLGLATLAVMSLSGQALSQSRDYTLQPSTAAKSLAATRDIVFSTTVPNSVRTTITVPEGQCSDIQISARDCCIRDDVVAVILGGCQVAAIDSRGGEFGTHAGEVHTLSVGPGTHTIEYRLLSDNEGPSGWEVSETVLKGTGRFICGGGKPVALDVARTGLPTCGEVESDVLLKTFRDDVGNEINITCTDQNPFVDEYHVTIGGSSPPKRIGRCPYEGGQNEGLIFHTGDFAPLNGQPDCFLATVWTSFDEGKKDDDGDGKKDRTTYTYGVLSRTYSEQNFEVNSPPTLVSVIEGEAPDVDAPLAGPRTLQTEPHDPMSMRSARACDLNGDDRCDAIDHLAFQQALGSKLGDAAYDPAADFNKDRQVDLTDAEYLGFLGPISVESQTVVGFSGMVHDRRRTLSQVRATVTNVSDAALTNRLVLVLQTVSDPFVKWRNAEGVTSDGKPFVTLTSHVPGNALEPNETTMPVALQFENPLLRPFSIKMEVRAHVVE